MLENGSDYLQVLSQVKREIAQTRTHAARCVNSELICMYWRIGAILDAQSYWGSKAIETLSQDMYARESIESGWSHSVLVHQIESHLYERQKLSKTMNNFSRTLPEPESELAQQSLKDPFIFDFITARQNSSERDIEERMVKYALRSIDQPMGISSYRLGDELPEGYKDVLPSPEDLQVRI